MPVKKILQKGTYVKMKKDLRKYFYVAASAALLFGSAAVGIGFNGSNAKAATKTVVYDGKNLKKVKATKSKFKLVIKKGVKKIPSEAFYDCENIVSVSIPQSVNSIGSYAFYGTDMNSITVNKKNKTFDSRSNCNAVIAKKSKTLVVGCKNTKIPKNISKIGENAFTKCTGLKKITIPANIKTIGKSSFQDCANLKSVSIAKGVTTISYAAFTMCESLETVKIPSSVKTIGESAFNECYSLKKAEFSEGLQKIDKVAFSNCIKLSEIKIPASVKEIGSNAFVSCSSLQKIEVAAGNKVYDSRNNCNAIINTADNRLEAACSTTVIPNDIKTIGSYAFITAPEKIDLPSSVTSLSDYAFANCGELVEITIPDSVKELGDGVFFVCDKLQKVKLPSGMTKIPENFFYDCYSLKELTIQSTVTEISESAIAGCEGLEKIEVESGNTVYDSRDNCNAVIETKTNTLLTGCKNTIIPKTVTTIADSAFYYRGDAKFTLEIPNSVTKISEEAFQLDEENVLITWNGKKYSDLETFYEAYEKVYPNDDEDY